jgi:hypothetical protein
MSATQRHRVFAKVAVWWLIATRALVLVLTLAVGTPLAGIAEDTHYGGVSHEIAALGTVIQVGSGLSAVADPDAAPQTHSGQRACGCHHFANLDEIVVLLLPDRSRPSYADPSDHPTSVPPARPARPPQA